MPAFRFEAIGTPWEIETPLALDPATAKGVLATVEAFDATYSRFRNDSLVSQMARAADGGIFSFSSAFCGLSPLPRRAPSA